MGCFGRIRDQEKHVLEEQKWEFITLSDFTSSSWKAKLSYLWLWVLSGIAIAVYAADTFTAVNLLAFNKWSSQVDPAIDINISKWIFTGCIIFSWVLAGFEWLRAFRVMRGGGVADSYLDPLAATLQSSRIYSGGHGWRRFLVFAELTKSKKGADYIALFVYFQFKSAIRILLAEGPRQVVNGVTLWAAMKADLLPEGEHAATDGTSSADQFFANLKLLAEEQREQAIILSSMLFTLIIWVLSALSLILAGVLYVLFLWHYVPSGDGTLANYCRRKVDKRLERVVSVKVQKALEKQEKMIRKEEEDAARAAAARMQRQNTAGTQKSTKSQKSQKPNVLHSKNSRPEMVVPRKPTLPQVQGLDRTDTQSSVSTLPPYSSQPPTRPGTSNTNASSRAPTLPHIGEDAMRPLGPSRSDTQSSGWSAQSYGSNAPLLGGAGDMGTSTPPPVPPMPVNYERSLLGGPQPRSYTPQGPPLQARSSPAPYGPNGYYPPQGPPAQARSSPAPNGPNGYYPPPRTNTAFSAGQPQQRSYTPMDRPPMPMQMQMPMQMPMQGRSSPAVGPNPYGPGPNAFVSNGYGPPPQMRGSPAPSIPMRQNTGYSMNDGYDMPPPGPMRTNTGTPGPSPLGNVDFGPYGRQSPAIQMPGPAYELQHRYNNNAGSDYDDSNGSYSAGGYSAGGYSAGADEFDPYRANTPVQQRYVPAAPMQMQRERSASNDSTRSLTRTETQQPPQGGYVAFNPSQNSSAPVSHSREGSVSPVYEDEATATIASHARTASGDSNKSASSSHSNHSSHSRQGSQPRASRNFSTPWRSSQQREPLRPMPRRATDPVQPLEQVVQDAVEQRPSTAGRL